MSAVLKGFLRFFEPVRLIPQVGTMLVIVALVLSGNAIVAPVLGLYADSFASSSTLVGMVITIFGLARLFVNYPAGALSQRIGRRPLMLSGLAVIVVGSVGAALATSMEMLLLWRFCQGLGSGLYMSVSLAAMADLSTDATRGRVMALQQASSWLGIGLGPVLGGFLAHHFGLPAPFWAYGAVCGIAGLIMWFRLNETHDQQFATPAKADIAGDAAGNAAVHRYRLSRNPTFVLMCAITFGLFFVRTSSQWLLIPLLAHARYGMSVDVIGLALALLAVGTFIILPLTGNLIDRYGAPRVIIFSLLLTAAALMLIALGTAELTFWIGMFLLGTGLGISNPATSSYSIEIVPRFVYGQATGMLRTWGDVGFVLGPVVVGLLDDFGGAGAVGGILTSAALVAVMTLPFRLKSIRAGQRR